MRENARQLATRSDEARRSRCGMSALLHQPPDLDPRPGYLAAADGAPAGLQVVDSVIGRLSRPPPWAEAEGAFPSQRRLNQVVEVPDLIGVPRFRRTEFDQHGEALRPRAQAGSRDRLANRGHDVSALLEQVEAAGGRVLGPPTDMPRGQRVAHIHDPDGNMVNLTQTLPRYRVIRQLRRAAANRQAS